MTTIVWAGVTLTDALQPPQHHFGVAIEGSRVVATGAVDDLRQRYPTAAVVGSADYLLIPSFTNAHDHGRGLGTFPLGAPDDLLEIWLPGLFSQPGVDPYLITLWESIQLLHAGVTLTGHSHNPQAWETMEREAADVIRAYQQVGVRVAFHPPLVDQNPLVYAQRDEFLAGLPAEVAAAAQRFLGRNPLTHADYFALCTRLHATFHDPVDHKVHIQISPAGGQWCSDELILGSVEWARQHGTRIQMHMLETQYQRTYAWEKWGKSFVAHLDEIGALGEWLTLAHMIWTEPDDLPRLAAARVGIASNPGSNLRLRSGVAPLPAYLAHGLRVGIGMDGQTLDDDQDYLRELRLAWTLANRPGAASPTVDGAAILNLGTHGGAAITLGDASLLGRLTPGAPADLVLVDYRAVQHPWAASTVAPADMLLRKGSRQHVRHVMMGGEWVLRDGRATRVDEEEVAAALAEQLNRYDLDELVRRNAAAVAVAPALRRFYAGWDDRVRAPQMFF